MEPEKIKSHSEKPNKPPKSDHHLSKYIIIGLTLAASNFLVYTLMAHLIFKNNDLLWIASIISYLFATFLGYFLHSRITWKERTTTKRSIIIFFAWNFLTALAISPFFTWLFSLIAPVYQFAYQISSNLHLPFTYEFVESTGIFGFTAVVTTIMNYLVYDKLTFKYANPKNDASSKSPK